MCYVVIRPKEFYQGERYKKEEMNVKHKGLVGY